MLLSINVHPREVNVCYCACTSMLDRSLKEADTGTNGHIKRRRCALD